MQIEILRKSERDADNHAKFDTTLLYCFFEILQLIYNINGKNVIETDEYFDKYVLI